MNEKKVGVMGSTGSIGTQTLEIVEHYPERLQAVALAGYGNVKKMEEQARKFHPELIVMYLPEAAKELKLLLSDTDIRILSGMEGLLEMAALPSMDTLVTAVVGMIGIRPTMEAIKNRKTIALANKETLVTAGHLIMPLAEKEKVAIYPVDSEHSAIFQCLQGNKRKQMKRILLTASGGPFRGKSKEELENITVEQALKHPNWTMGRKITIDSSTLVNKGLEVMEAKWLFRAELKDIQVLVHPQSVIHSAVEYEDGAVIAQMGTPDMKLPIQYALFYPDRLPVSSEQLDLFKLGTLTFEEPDLETFQGLKLAYQAAELGGSVPTVYNAANEAAVELFLNKKIRYPEITARIEEAMNEHKKIAHPSLEQILDAEKEAREYVYIHSAK